ncbi:MAG TPA: hypothetical protein VHW93_05770 [Acidimicrobiales bacterium]|nr:hypothetical protein [Acidimicrobiales bacterium]
MTRARRRPVTSFLLMLVVGLVAILSTSCNGASSATATTKAPLPAGPQPAAVSKEVCVSDAPHDVGLALGEKPTVTKPTWVDHLYTCRYSYPGASMTLSVKELSSWPQTVAYFNGLATQLGKARQLKGLGQGAFQTPNGSVVVRKDWKVLLVDVSDLPASFGHPPTTPGVIGVAVADVVLGCWAGD